MYSTLQHEPARVYENMNLFPETHSTTQIDTAAASTPSKPIQRLHSDSFIRFLCQIPVYVVHSFDPDHIIRSWWTFPSDRFTTSQENPESFFIFAQHYLAIVVSDGGEPGSAWGKFWMLSVKLADLVAQSI